MNRIAMCHDGYCIVPPMLSPNCCTGSMYLFFFCHTKNVDMTVKNAFSTHSFISPMTPYFPNYSGRLCAALSSLTPPFQMY